jgi:hypothetical protein
MFSGRRTSCLTVFDGTQILTDSRRYQYKGSRNINVHLRSSASCWNHTAEVSGGYVRGLKIEVLCGHWGTKLSDEANYC